MEIRKASRKKVKMKMGISAISGGGKTLSALLLAYGITNNWEKIVVIDTENKSAELYADRGGYYVLPLEAPFTPEKYINAITAAEHNKFEVIIIDSISHEWEGKGGILEISNEMSGNSYTNWAKLTPRHRAFVDKLLQCDAHVITTVRRKQDYELVTNEKGKLAPQKAGLKEITRDGFEYELTINFELDTKHMVSVSKDRTGLFMDKPEFVITPETGKQILDWCNLGIDVEAERKKTLLSILSEVEAIKTIEEIVTVWNKYPAFREDKTFNEAIKLKKSSLTK